MAAKINPQTGVTEKQDKFCKAYLATGNASHAYRTAYDTQASSETIRVNASKLMQETNITLRLQVLRDRMDKKHHITTDTITTRLEEITDKALSINKLSAAVSAQALVARLHGLDIQKVSVTVKRETTPEERLAIIMEIMQQAQPQLTIDNNQESLNNEDISED